jgi:hypothetical protein
MQQISIPQMKDMIDHLGVRKRRPLYFHGPSGIGKSEAVHQSCTDHDGVMVDIRVSQYESIDFRGIPDVQNGATVWNMPATVPFKGNSKFTEDERPIYLFLDEVNQGDPSVMSVLYQLINDRRIGEHMLMDNVSMICAGNRATDRGVTNKFPDPLSNRMTHAELVPDVKAWSAWAAKADISPTLIGFLNFRSELLHTHDPNKPASAFATPRTWSFVNADFVDELMPADIKQAAISGSVGEGPGIELGAFVEIMNSIKPIEEIIADPEGIKIETGLDIQWAMATHVAGHMAKDNADQLHKFLKRLEPEMVVMAWTMAIQRDENITDTNAFLFSYASEYRGLFQS